MGLPDFLGSWDLGNFLYQFNGQVPPPTGGLGGSSNYLIYGGGNPLLNLTVTVEITEDIYAPFGCSFQLNCDFAPNSNTSWQQYTFIFDAITNEISASIDNWPTPAFAATVGAPGDLLNTNSGPLLTLTGQLGRIPAGTWFTVTLVTVEGGIVQAVNFSLGMGQETLGAYTPSLGTLDVDGVNPPEVVPASGLDPVDAVQLNIVGKYNLEYTYIESGAGTITYELTSPMTVVKSRPTNVEGTFTGEQSNSTYGLLQVGTSLSIVQTFGVNLTGPTFQPGWGLAASQQIGLNQTDLFVISKTGQLTVFYVFEGGHWQQLGPLGPICMAGMGAAIAVSQQFGCDNQTDAFVIDQFGTLQLFWVNGAGSWNGPQAISNPRAAYQGAPLVASQQFGANNQTDVFFFDLNGQLNIFWAFSDGSWNGPLKVGPETLTVSAARLAVSQQFGANQTDVFVIDNNGALNVFWVVGQSGFIESAGNWSGPQTISSAGLAPPGGGVAAGQQIGGNNQTDVFLVDNNGQLNVFWVVENNWGGPLKIGPKGLAPPGAPVAVSQQFGLNRTCVFVVDYSGALNVCWVDGTGNWQGPKKISPAGLAPAASELAVCQQFGVANQTDAFFVNQPGAWPMVASVDGTGLWEGPNLLVTQV